MKTTVIRHRVGDSALMGRVSTRRVGLNSLWLMLARGGSQGLSFLFALLIARHLGQAGLGQFAFIAAVVLLGNVFTTFGMDTLLLREIARLRHLDTPSFTTALLVQLGLAILFILLAVTGASLLPNQSAATLPALRLASLSLLPLAFSTTYNAALRAFERMDLYMVATVFPAVLQVVAALILLRDGAGLLGMAWVMLGSQASAALLAAVLAWQFLPGFGHRRRITPGGLRLTLAAGASLALLMGVAVVYQRLAILLLSLLAGDEETGWFAVAARLVEAAKMVPYAYFGALFPIMARSAHGRSVRGQEVRAVAGAATRSPAGGNAPFRFSRRWDWFLVLFALLVALAANALATPLIRILFGDNYGPAGPILRILAWSLLPFMASLKISVELVSGGREKSALLATLLSTLFTAPLLVTMLRIFGLSGAAWAVVVGEVVQATALLLMKNYAPPSRS